MDTHGIADRSRTRMQLTKDQKDQVLAFACLLPSVARAISVPTPINKKGDLHTGKY